MQKYSVSSLRILFPSLYPFHALLDAHEQLMEDSPKMVDAIRSKLDKFPLNPTIQ